MRQVFTTPRFETVGLYQSILENEGIPTMIRNENTSGLDGSSPGDIIHPELWVLEDSDFERAIEILRPLYEGSEGNTGGEG
ncbi:MAG: DUF2007 domain-containing protein [Verrucomicrobiales bacterium]|nr:DUF2007 domain-containing protein [Verrucomicrobiales bacterium]